MKNIITFIIPVRHQKNASNWEVVKTNLKETIKSVRNQDSPGWKAVIIANYGADLPEIPEGFEVKRVDFPPNPIFSKNSAPVDEVYEAVRIDKGRRILAGMIHAGEMGHVMIVDDDDFVHRKITSFVAENSSSNGYFIQDGFVWACGGKWLYHYDGDFSHLCGTSHIIRSDLYNLPHSFEAATDSYIKKMLGSHRFIFDELRKNGNPLSKLPFLGAIYRVGHSENHSQSNSIFEKYIFKRHLWKHPIRQVKRLARLRIINKTIKNDFFGCKY